jgi:pimeloyl-ACP methyl ester carboxylesterase
MTTANSDTTVVLAHAAWADGSSWNKVTGELQRKGFNVVAAQMPLTSFTDDVAVLKKVLLRQKGPIVLAGHSYGGAVITAAAAGNPHVKALVYIAAIVPDEGETVGDVFRRVPPHPSAAKLQPDADGFLWLTVDAFRNAFATLSRRTHRLPRLLSWRQPKGPFP